MPATTITKTYDDIPTTTRDRVPTLNKKISDVSSSLTAALTKAKGKGKFKKKKKGQLQPDQEPDKRALAPWFKGTK